MICLQFLNVRTKTLSEYIPAAEQAADRLHCFGGSFSRQWCEDRTRRWIYWFSFWAVNCCKSLSQTGLFSWNSGLFRPFSSFKLNSGVFALIVTSTTGSFVIAFLLFCKTPWCVRMKPNHVMLTDRHSPQLSFSHPPTPHPWLFTAIGELSSSRSLKHLTSSRA